VTNTKGSSTRVLQDYEAAYGIQFRYILKSLHLMFDVSTAGWNARWVCVWKLQIFLLIVLCIMSSCICSCALFHHWYGLWLSIKFAKWNAWMLAALYPTPDSYMDWGVQCVAFIFCNESVQWDDKKVVFVILLNVA